MAWVLIFAFVVGAGASIPQVKNSSADPSRRSVGAEAEAKAAYDRGRAAHSAGKAVFSRLPALVLLVGPTRITVWA